MATSVPDLWPDNFGTLTEVPPSTILRQQAARLGEKTQHLVEGDVQSQPDRGSGKFLHSFYLVVPSLDNYMYRLLYVKHDLNFYPIEIVCDTKSKSPIRANNQNEFVQALQDILRAQETTRIIQTLMAQAQSAGS